MHGGKNILTGDHRRAHNAEHQCLEYCVRQSAATEARSDWAKTTWRPPPANLSVQRGWGRSHRP